MPIRIQISEIFNCLLQKLGPSGWWPADSPFEVMVGAILTQNTNWSNVERAIKNLKEASLLTPEKIHNADNKYLAKLIRPAGYYNVKTKRLKNLMLFLKNEVNFRLNLFDDYEQEDLRECILQINGIGPETADAILLYAFNRPSFVVDTYTYRIFNRHGIAYEGIDYHTLRSLFMDALPVDVPIYKEYHALIVRTGKEWCKKNKGQCSMCPLQSFLDR